MICVLYETGARVSVFMNIKLDDLNLSDNASITLYGKDNKTRVVSVSPELVKIINKYLKGIYIDYGNDYLFYSNKIIVILNTYKFFVQFFLSLWTSIL